MLQQPFSHVGGAYPTKLSLTIVQAVNKSFTLLGSSKSNTTLTAYSKSDNLVSELISVPLISHEDKTIPILISVTKLKGKGKNEQHSPKPFLLVNLRGTSPQGGDRLRVNR